MKIINVYITPVMSLPDTLTPIINYIKENLKKYQIKRINFILNECCSVLEMGFEMEPIDKISLAGFVYNLENNLKPKSKEDLN